VSKLGHYPTFQRIRPIDRSMAVAVLILVRDAPSKGEGNGSGVEEFKGLKWRGRQGFKI